MGWLRIRSGILLLFLALAACGPAAPPASPSAQPSPTAAAVLTIAAGPAGGQQLRGWIVRYREARPGTVVEVRAVGVGRAQELLAQGKVDLALLDEQPSDLYRGVLTATRVAWEPLVVVVHPQNPLRDISTPALVELYRGHITEWGLLGGAAGPVSIYTLPASSGTVQSFVGEALAGRPLSSQAIVVASVEALRQAVAADPGGIGLLPAGAVSGDDTAMGVDGLLPGDPRYPWRSPLFLVHGRQATAAAQEFIFLAIQAEINNQGEGTPGIQPP